MTTAVLLVLTILSILLLVSNAFHANSYLTKRYSVPALFAGNTPLVANGKRVEAAEGSSLNAACQKLGLKVPFKCKKGECGTCTVTVGGIKYKACVAKVPPVPKLKSVLEKGLTVTVDNLR